jgi:hypothetical protein
MSDVKNRDPARYRRMSEPYPSIEKATDALTAFHAELDALRERHGVRDVHAVWSFSYMDGTEEIESVGHAHIGAVAKALPMLAWALGREEEALAADLSRIRKGRAR